MRKLSIITAAILLGLLAAIPAASAREAPWCAVMSMGTGSMRWDCSFATVEACRPWVISGNRGCCNPNPYYEPDPPRAKKKSRHVRHG